QFYSPGSNEPETPISGKEFMESVKAKMRVHGRPAGYEFAEGFNCSRIFGVNSLFSLH
ncbi:MAG: bacillithiol biosynthesis deacetylase BshB1, partial [Bacteroidia bacterium]|nr:bacillithiol biosynthesis deacetylase BshB1 [Bacteroidia bacterium]